jgi:prolyl 4-hydroxylase
MAQVAHYTAGGKFNAHYDACNSDNAYCDKMNRHAGQRRATLLVYLNDDFDGGQTVFPHIGKTVTPKKGMGILFWNTTAETDAIIPESMHKGNPVVRGEKWICTKWSHAKAYPPHAL